MARYSDSRRFVLETSDVAEMLEAYNRRCGKHLRLGKRIASGGFGEVYNVIGTDTPQVMKVVDTRKKRFRTGRAAGPSGAARSQCTRKPSRASTGCIR